MDAVMAKAYFFNMKRKKIIVVILILLVLLSPVLLRKYHVPLVPNGKTVAVATRPFIFPFLGEGQCDVYRGQTRIFSLWADSFDAPIFIYPFADGKRFLCDYDYDTAILVFVVDFSDSPTNVSTSTNWPVGYASITLSQGMTNVVMETKGHVRLPNYAEVQEASAYLAILPSSQIKNYSFPTFDFGLYRIYAPRNFLLADLATNRDSDWPTLK